METSTDKIRRLQQEIRNEQRLIDSCKHEYTDPIYDPEIKQVGYGCKVIGQGSDIWSEFEGYSDKEFPRWSKTCKKCGHKVYTEKQKPVKYEPDFN